MVRTAKKKTKKKKNMKGRPRGGASVPCPNCDADSRVVITRRSDHRVNRNRVCANGHYFHTVEKVA